MQSLSSLIVKKTEFEPIFWYLISHVQHRPGVGGQWLIFVQQFFFAYTNALPSGMVSKPAENEKNVLQKPLKLFYS